MDLAEFYEGGPKSWNEAFPPMCLKSHWDPTMVSERIIPSNIHTNMMYDPRPSSKICTAYYNSSEPTQKTEKTEKTEKAVFPPGGKAGLNSPFSFQASVESDILRLNEPLTKCAERRYIPVETPPVTNVVPNYSYKGELSQFVSSQAGCRDDNISWNRSSRLFFNPTKYDRTVNNYDTLSCRM